MPIATSDDLIWADAILFSSPTRFGNLTAQMKFISWTVRAVFGLRN